MKARMLCGGLLALLLGSMSLISCPTGTPLPEEKKTVDEKFWGEWKNFPVDYGVYYIIDETTFVMEYRKTGHDSKIWNAWSEGDILFVKEKYMTESYELQEDGSLEKVKDPGEPNPVTLVRVSDSD